MEKLKVDTSPKGKVISEKLIKSLLLKCGVTSVKKRETEESDTHQDNNEPDWAMPEMVGFYSQASIPVSPVVPHHLSEDLTVKKLVCSPDLPISQFSKQPAAPIGQQASTESIQCQICHKMYTSKVAFQVHQRSHGKEMEDPYRCNICAKTFAVPARLTRHYRTHTGEKPFKCEFCLKSFSVKENLSVHRRIHTKERPYKCEVCSRAFEHSGKLHRHMRIHTGERPHKCNVCSKTFIQSGQLVIHMRTHTGEKPYVCNVCEKGFTCSKQLKVHSRTHTGEKPYSCKICGKSFGYNHVLKLHQVAHYGEKVYKCTICNSTFTSKKSMEAHIKTHDGSPSQHPPQPPTPPASNPSSESSCSSIGSEKENFKATPVLSPEESHQVTDADINYLVYTRGQISPTYLQSSYPVSSAGVELLAAAASAREAVDMYTPTSQDLLLSLVKPPPITRHPAYFSSPSLTAGDDIRKRVEEALVMNEFRFSDQEKRLVMDEANSSDEEKAMTPPSSNPVSPVPSENFSPSSPDPELSLPPRKRSRMIQKSMEASSETSLDLSPVRYSVIQYARAS